MIKKIFSFGQANRYRANRPVCSADVLRAPASWQERQGQGAAASNTRLNINLTVSLYHARTVPAGILHLR